jgi:Uma2 family endonuclease
MTARRRRTRIVAHAFTPAHAEGISRMHMAQHLKRRSLAELDRLPDDGNRYELVRGELFVTPPPTPEHETIASLLSAILEPYVAREKFGLVYRPRAVVRVGRSRVEPDLMVRDRIPRGTSWADAPRPRLVAEVLSPTTRQRDHLEKRNLYMNAGIPEYWILDDEERSLRVVRPDREDSVIQSKFVWRPAGVSRGLRIDVGSLFSRA